MQIFEAKVSVCISWIIMILEVEDSEVLMIYTCSMMLWIFKFSPLLLDTNLLTPPFSRGSTARLTLSHTSFGLYYSLMRSGNKDHSHVIQTGFPILEQYKHDPWTSSDMLT